MATAILTPTHAKLAHLRDDPIYKEEIPFEIWADNISKDVPRTNVKLDIIPDCALTDIRTLGDGEKPKLETWGFEFMQQEFPWNAGLRDADYVDLPIPKKAEILEKYVSSMSTFLREKLGCAEAVCWDYRVRRAQLTTPQDKPQIYSLKQEAEAENDFRSVKINSSQVIHADGSPQFMQKVVAQIVAQDESKWQKDTKYRTRVLTVWRPLVDVVETDPLVCCDTRTVEESDLDRVQKILDDSTEESMYLKRQERHQWYWMNAQTRNDVLVMTIWDSKTPDKKSTSVPHCAMVLPEHVPNAKPRESIELRFVIWNYE